VLAFGALLFPALSLVQSTLAPTAAAQPLPSLAADAGEPLQVRYRTDGHIDVP
jgi:hypothetical protein